MSDKDRRKKDGQDTNKKNQQMRAAPGDRQERADDADEKRDDDAKGEGLRPHGQGIRPKSGTPNDRRHAVTTK